MQSSKGRILYTEDDPDSRELIRFLLAYDGYEIVCAENGFQAVQLARTEAFDLFLIDNWMPTMTGLELTRFIREFNDTTPILFFSGAAREADRRAALDAGAQGYLTKPDGLDQLLDEVDKLIQMARSETSLDRCEG